MSGRKNTAWLETMTKKLGSREAVTEFMKQIGAQGGKATGPKGFALDRERARRAGALGGRISRRKKKGVVNEDVAA